MAPHRPRKSAPTEYVTDEKEITYDVEEEELEPDPTFKFALKESPISYPKGYLRALTPMRFRKIIVSSDTLWGKVFHLGIVVLRLRLLNPGLRHKTHDMDIVSCII
ncbi:hypothetical protein TNCV_3003401 [Trichonephila clavipes]|nr:hypothetical protein TNCV_3003401 [Trichonephila clavipes]